MSFIEELPAYQRLQEILAKAEQDHLYHALHCMGKPREGKAREAAIQYLAKRHYKAEMSYRYSQMRLAKLLFG